jgi:hypothetical protein
MEKDRRLPGCLGLRRFFAPLLVGTFLIPFAPILAAEETGSVKLVVRVFRVPRDQSFEAVLHDGKGREVSVQGHGPITGDYPRATLFSQTELAAYASSQAVASAIEDRVAFGSGGMAFKRIRIEELKALELELGAGHQNAQARFEESRGEGRSSDYEVRADLLSSDEERVVVRLRYDAGWSVIGGRLGVSMSEGLISAPFEIEESKLFLIGAPPSGSGGASPGAVYWLAVAALR